MNTVVFHRLFLSCTLLLSSIMPHILYGGNTSSHDIDVPSHQELHALYQETLEKYFQRALEQIRKIDSMLESLAFNVANNSTMPVKNRSQAIIAMRTIRELLSGLKDTRFILLNEQLVSSYIFVIHTTISRLTTQLIKGIEALEPLDISKLNFPTKTEIRIEDLEQGIAENNELIARFDKLSNNIGLHWYNKTYRSVKRNIVDPAKALALPAFCTGAIAATAFLAWYYSDMENPKWLRDRIGWPAMISSEYIVNDPTLANPAMQNKLAQLAANVLATAEHNGFSRDDIEKDLKELLHLQAPNPVGWFGRLEARIHGLANGRFVLGTMIMSAGALIGHAFLPTLSNWVTKKIKIADNFLMGGAYMNRAVDDFVYSVDVTFDHLIGEEDAKQYGRELCQYLKNPELFDRAKIAPSTGILLFGETRTGKSYYISALFGEIQKALGKEAVFKMWKVSFQELLRRGIQDIMDEARRDAPMIVVIEEIDLLGLQRVNNAERLATFMTAMSSCLQENTLDKTVIIVGTTNKLENLEPALRETGRFGKHIYFSYPKFNERRLFIERELIKAACILKNFDLDALARDTEGCSFEKLGLFIKRAFLRAKLYNDIVTQATLEQSIDEHIRGISRGQITLDNEQKQLIAAHLAGHAVASFLLNPHQKISKITLHDVASKIEEELAVIHLIRKDEKDTKQAPMEHGKIFANLDHDMPGIETKEEKSKQCKICLAGHIAETLMLGSCGYGYHAHDKQLALNIAKSMTCATVDLTELPHHIRDQYYDAAFALLNTCEQEVTKLLEEHRTELAAVMNALMEKSALNSLDLRRLILGEQSVVEQLDATNILANLLKEQTTMLDSNEQAHTREQQEEVTGQTATPEQIVQA